VCQCGRCGPVCQHAIQGRVVLVGGEGGHRAGANFSWKKGTTCCSRGKRLFLLSLCQRNLGGDGAYAGSRSCSTGRACTGAAACVAQRLLLAGCRCQGQREHEAMARPSLQKQMLQSRVTASLLEVCCLHGSNRLKMPALHFAVFTLCTELCWGGESVLESLYLCL